MNKIKTTTSPLLLTLFSATSLIYYSSPSYSRTKFPMSNIGRVEAPLQFQHISSPRSVLFTIFRAAFSPDGKYAAFLGSIPDHPSHFAVAVYDSRSWKVIKLLTIDTKASFGDFAGGLSFSPDSKFLAAGMDKISVWNVLEWKLISEISGPYSHGEWAASGVLSLAFSPDGGRVAALYNEAFWPLGHPVNTRTEAVSLTEEAKANLSTGKSPTYTREPVIVVSEIKSGSMVFGAKLYGTNVNRYSVVPTHEIAYSNSGLHIIASGLEYPPLGSSDMQRTDVFIASLDSSTGSLVKTIHGVSKGVVSAIMLPTGTDTVLTGSSAETTADRHETVREKTMSSTDVNSVRLWDMTSGRQVRQFGSFSGSVRAMYARKGDDRLISCQVDEKDQSIAKVWNIGNGALIGSSRLDQYIHGQFLTCAISPDGKILVIPRLGKESNGQATPDVLYVINLI